jgi:hypothetical protein
VDSSITKSIRRNQKKLYKHLKKMRGKEYIMGIKLLWTGVTFILAVGPALEAIGLHASSVLVLVGAIFMVIGCVLLWLDR